MVKIVGSIIMSCALLCSSIVLAQVTLKIVDTQGEAVDRIGAGVPFKIIASAQGSAVQHRDLMVQGLEQAAIEGHESRMQRVNGDRTIAHVYTARINKTGSYVFGPALVETKGQRLQSEPVTLEVVAAGRDANTRQTKQKEAVFARLSVDKDDIFIGETVRCSLRFYTKNDEIQPLQVVVPSTGLINPKAYEGPVTGSETMQGVRYSYVEWEWNCAPQQVGDLVIPAFGITYTMPIVNDGFGGFSAFFGISREQHMVYTNAVELQVKDLPAYTGKIDGVGVFTSFTSDLQPAQARVGQGIVYTLRVEGVGDLSKLVAPALAKMPSALKYYDSQTSVEQKSGKYIKTFEYIVQATQPGTWTIPAQTFTFFNTATAEYQTLTSRPQTATIEGLAVATTGENNQSVPSHDVDTQDNDELAPLLADGGLVARPCWSIPWWFLIMVAAAPFVMLGARVLYGLVQRHYGADHNARNKVAVFARATRRLKDAEKKSAYQELYPLFMELLAARLGATYTIATEDDRARALARSGLSAEQNERWHQFCAQCAAFIFSAQTAHPDPALFRQAQYWITVFEALL